MASLPRLYIFLVLLVLSLADRPSFPLYHQCGESWSNYPISTGPDTICQIGCLLCAVSEALTGYGIKLPIQMSPEVPTPDVTNDWLIDNGGYDGYNFLFPSLNQLGFEYVEDLKAINDTLNYIDNEDYLVFLHVQNAKHFVLSTGYNASGIFVQDSLYNRTMYNFTEVVDAPLYRINMTLVRENQGIGLVGGFLE